MTRRPSNVHARCQVLTGHDLADHTDHAAWLGEPALLNLAVFGG